MAEMRNLHADTPTFRTGRGLRLDTTALIGVGMRE